MNRTLALRVEILQRRRNYLQKKLTDLGPDASPSAWIVKEIDALEMVLRLVANLDAEDALEEWLS